MEGGEAADGAAERSRRWDVQQRANSFRDSRLGVPHSHYYDCRYRHDCFHYHNLLQRQCHNDNIVVIIAVIVVVIGIIVIAVVIILGVIIPIAIVIIIDVVLTIHLHKINFQWTSPYINFMTITITNLAVMPSSCGHQPHLHHHHHLTINIQRLRNIILY
jgi:hypothetical protein